MSFRHSNTDLPLQKPRYPQALDAFQVIPNYNLTMNDQNQTQEQNPFLSNLPTAPFMGSTKAELVKYQGCWYNSNILTSVPTFQNHFQARHTDLILASTPKTGTTWLKALLFAIVNRTKNNLSHLLQKHNPHELVYGLEYAVYGTGHLTITYPQAHHLDELPSPRLFHTHMFYSNLAESIRSSRCKVVYIGRNPMDTLISQWHFYPHIVQKTINDPDFQPPSLEEYMEHFARGTIPYGPYFGHILDYWKVSLEQPDKVLFLKYEDIKSDASSELKKMAEFVGFPFSDEEEKKGVIEEIIQLCSIKHLQEQEVNKSGMVFQIYESKSFFRKGEVGDWTNYFTPQMMERMNKLMEEKFKDSGLSFELCSK